LLSTTACPQNYVTTCPIYRGEITVVPGRNEMYAWFVSLDSSGNPLDQGIWQSTNSGASWTQISDAGIISCGDSDGCGVQQGFYNLELLAVPNGASATDLYAGAINLYKCSINSSNATCSSTAFMNLTHVYGCDPLGALAHVHPDQHALAYTIPPASGTDLMYFANDGGIYRALDGFGGLTTGSCSGTNQFDDLNQNLGSMTQFVSFSQHATNPNTLLGGTQDNGSPATATATTSSSWGNVLGGDGGYNAIDPATNNWFASNPDTGSGTLNIQECSSDVNCDNSLFNVVVSSSSVGGDDGSFYFPYILDPQSTTALLVGTCRVWRGTIGSGAAVALTAVINIPNNAIPATYNIEINTQDVTGAPSHTWPIALTVNQDFTLSALTPATQTITAGQSASYNFSVLPVGASFANAVNLSCSGGPVVSLCSFTPNPVTPGGNSAAVVMQITTTSNAASLFPQGSGRAVIFYALWLALPGLALLGSRVRGGKRAKHAPPASLLGLFLLALLLPSCGGGGSNGGGGGGGGLGQGTQPGTYTITVTGTSGTLSHQAPSSVTLIVN
jgi:hypothetical protein